MHPARNLLKPFGVQATDLTFEEACIMSAYVDDIDQFLSTINKLENKIHHLIDKSNLSDIEKKMILDHILIVPSIKKVSK
jgi:16S rRNA G527 N7-methylase RsmG